MLKKTLIIGMMLASLLIISTYSVSAMSEVKTIKDNEDDVIKTDFTEGTEIVVSNKPNIDITKIKYEQIDQTVTITLTVKGKIENRGNIDDLIGLYDDDTSFKTDYDLVEYEIYIGTSSGSFYNILYVNKECNMTMTNEEGFITPKSNSSTGSNLVISFNLPNSDETINSINAISVDIKIQSALMMGKIYQDEIPDIGELEVTASASSNRETKKPVNFYGNAEGGSSEYELIWDFGDDVGYSNLQNPTYTYEEPGTYEVTLYVMDVNQEFNEGDYTFSITITNESIVVNDKINENTEESSFPAVLTFLALIALIAIAGITVLVYIIRK